MSDNKVLATVNGKDITNQDVYNFLNHLDPQIAAQFHSPQAKSNSRRISKSRITILKCSGK